LASLLDDNDVLLIDVRNRTEMNDPGMITGSHCLPVHEVDLAFQLSEDDFEDRFVKRH
jgi:rhodanese-related sulfurtransferase